MFFGGGFNELFLHFINHPELIQLPDRVTFSNSSIALKLYAF